MPDTKQLLLKLPAHHNHGLFADHYLDRVLPDRADWACLTGEAAPVLAEVSSIFAAYLPSNDEQQTERDLVRPILEILGHTYEVQGRLRVPGRIHKPDYVFYRDIDAKNANRNVVLDKSLPEQGGIAVGDAKYWGRSLDNTLNAGNADDNRNPAFQIYWYMLHSGVEWGILTNGKLWRLVHRDTADRLDIYYEIDLQELVQSGDVKRFLYFYAFFRRASFNPGPLGLSALLRASTDYAHAVGVSLKSQVYDALRHIAQGFLDYAPNNLQPEPAALRAIHDNALILLYRIIFILYAEARELLPLRESDQYRETYSLQAIKRIISQDIRAGRRLLPTSARIWQQLKELFGFIDRGEPPLQIATFNGGLFDPKRYPFLEKYLVGDHHLQQAIDMLARVKGEFIDYRDLSVRHMGTIYEGLLEYHLQPLIESEDGWSIEIVNDKGERKATGSYYTPDYIVKFIVEHTVGPALREAVEARFTDSEKIRAVLEVNVLDPAMGSGHFLVEAVEYISRFLVDLGVTPVGKTPEEADLAFWKRRVVQSCIYGVDLNPLAVELAKLSLWLVTVAKDRPLSFLDHHLRPGNSLVGARLTNLQNHDVTSVVKKRKKVKVEAPEQIALFTDADFTQRMAVAVGSMWIIEESDASTVAQVKSQEQQYNELRRQLTGKFGKLADLLTARYFGIVVPADLWTATVDFVMGRTLAVPTAIQELVQQAADMATKERFFHWELEFPEVFFDRHGRPLGEDGGFEAVIGNPPYVRQEQLAPYKPIFQSEFPEVYHGVADLFVYFFEQGLQQTKRGGRLSYISSNSWLRANYATPLRKFLRETTTVDLLVDVGDNQVFKEAPDVYPAVHVVRKTIPSDDCSAQAAVFTRGEGVRSFDSQVEEKLIPVSIHDQQDSGWQLSCSNVRQLFAKLMAAGEPLSKLVGGRMYRGVLTGLNEAFIIDQMTRDRLIEDDPGCKPLLKKILRGEDLRPWYQEDENRWLIFTRRGIDIDAYPSIKHYLKQYRELLEPKPADWNEGLHWFGRKSGNYKWYEIQDSIEYYQEFDRPKVFWPDLSNLPRFSLDDGGIFINNKGYIIPDADPFLLGVLQSRVIWFAISQVCLPLGERAGLPRYQLFTQYTGKLPIPGVSQSDRKFIGDIVMIITKYAHERYTLHERVQYRLQADLGTPDKSLNQKLLAWWKLDFTTLRSELHKVFKRDIAIKDRDEWEEWFATQRAEHLRLTDEIISREIDLNARVYHLFNLTPEEITIIEESTKYQYGEV